ncbi:hypothetical protein C8J57DRAFT_1517927 [Mycena rebaudengoi]|nr:hypothetical protein C8J57DRAFT_1517927 [Mycena rebaudengoi]
MDNRLDIVAKFPALTHLCLMSRNAPSILLPILRACDKLQVLVDMYFTQEAVDHSREAPYAIDDPRFVMIINLNYFKDLVVGANGGTDFWIRAERFVAKKRRGEIQPGLSSLIFTSLC